MFFFEMRASKFNFSTLIIQPLLHIYVVCTQDHLKENINVSSDMKMTPASRNPVHKHLLLVEDNPVFVEQIQLALLLLPNAWHVSAVADGTEALSLIGSRREQFDLALIDIGLPDMSGIDVICACSQLRPAMPVVVISVMASQSTVLKAIEAGAKGYILKDSQIQEISNCITQIMNGIYPISSSLARFLFEQLTKSPETQAQIAKSEFQLTPREFETLKILSQGLSYSQTAEKMGVTLSTIQFNVRNLYSKLNVRSQAQAICKARENNLI